MNLPQRIRDYLREREIQRLSACVLEAILAHDKAKARQFDAVRMATIRERSAGQVERMEVRKGLRTRTAIKRHVMQAFWHGRLPASVVTFVFRVFRLRSL